MRMHAGPRPFLTLSVLTVLLCLTAGPATAQEATQIRELPRPASSERPDAKIQENQESQDPEERRRTRELIQRLRQRIVEAESTANAFSSSLGELSYDLGQQLMKLNLYEDAMEALRRAEQIIRVNHGLYALEQKPVIEGMIEVNKATYDWESVDTNMERLVWLYRRNDQQDDPGYLQALEKQGQYHLAAYFWDVDDKGLDHLLRAEESFELMLEQSRQQGADYDPYPYEALSMINYSLMKYASRNDMQSDSEVDSLSSRHLGLRNHLNGSYRRGLNDLQEGIDRARQSEDPKNLVRATLMMADWHLLFDQRHNAQEYLKQSWQLAEQNGLTDAEMFDRPHLLPRQAFIESLPKLESGPDKDDEPTTAIVVRMDVDKWGAARNAEVPRSQEELENQGLERAAQRALRMARRSTYRPAVIEGETVDYDDYGQLVYVHK